MGRVKSLKAESGIGKQKLKTNFKKKVVRVRDRHADFSEQKLSCPICGTGNKTYRVLVTHCKQVHRGHMMVVVCPFQDCGWHCGFSLQCYIYHLMYEHTIIADGTTPIVLFRGKGDYSEHSVFCLKNMEDRNIPNQAELKLKLEMEYCRKEARNIIAHAIKEGRVPYPDMIKHFPAEDHHIIKEMYDDRSYNSLLKKYPVFDELRFGNYPYPKFVVENVATHIFSDRAFARIVDG